MNHGESDLIVTFYTPERGKLTGIARGAKRSKKRFVNKLEIFSQLDIIYQESKWSSLVRLDQAELVNSFPSLREQFQRFLCSSLICELLMHWTKENDEDRQLFELLVWALTCLDQGLDANKIVIFFQTRLFTLLGYQPQLCSCTVCGALNAAKGPYCFSPNRSGIVCSYCRCGQTDGKLLISLNTAKLLHRTMELPMDKLARLHFSAASTKEALDILQRYGQHILQRDINSWRFVYQQLRLHG